jgi:hypothetical protein
VRRLRAKGNALPPASVIPRWLKLAACAFIALLVPVYWWNYGPANFLWLSDLALFATSAALVFESPVLAGIAVGVLPLELAWCVDLLLGGRLGLTGYMFDPARSLSLRGLSLFHVVLPPVMLWLLHRWGYDRRSLARQLPLLWIALGLTYALTSPADNINWVFGPGTTPQNVIPPLAYLLLEMAAIPLVVLWPLDLLLRRLFSPPPGPAALQ